MGEDDRNAAQLRNDAALIFDAGLKAVDPKRAVKRYCRLENDHLSIGDHIYDMSRIDRVIVVGSGKASAPMAAAIEDILGIRINQGTVNVKYGHIDDLATIELIEAGHPVPDENGRKGSQKILQLVSNAGENDLVICLISGGGSALLPLPVSGLTLKQKQDTTNVLLACGATIHEINAIRKHLSAIKGGQLAKAAYPATIVTLMLSDVVGDDMDVIGSGPTVPDSSTFADCMNIFERYDILDRLPRTVVDTIRSGIAGNLPETPKSGDPIFDKTRNLIIGSNLEAVLAAAECAKTLGYKTLVLSSMIEGETREVARVHAAIAKEVIRTGHPFPGPACVLSGGETTVTITGKGLGGRNQEFVLAAAIDIAGLENMVILSGGTDGNDGPTDAAGAVADGATLARAADLGLNPHAYLSENDSYHFFEQLQDLLITGPTNTNVMDLRILLVA